MIKVMATMRRRWIWRLMLCAVVLAFITSYAGYALVQPVAAITPRSAFQFTRSAQPVSLAWPSYGEAALGAAGFGVLATHGSGHALATASTIKILTALAVLQQRPLPAGTSGPGITLTQADVDSYNKYIALGGSVVRVSLGEQLAEYEALEALLLPSANNIAETLARWAFGSIDGYNAYANTYARRLGMMNTTVTDPSGFMGTTVSTAHDLVILGEAAMSNPVIAEIVAQESAVIPVQGTIRNVNVLLGQDGIIGLKTGNNDQDPGCFLFAARQEVGSSTITIIGAIMNGPTLGTALWDALPLIRSAAKNFTEVTVVKTGDTVATYAPPWSKPIAAVADETISFAAWNGAVISSSVSLKALTAGSVSTSVGTLTAKGAANHTGTIVLERPLPAPNIVWKLLHPFRNRK